jgi:uncharacterized membrane protein
MNNNERPVIHLPREGLELPVEIACVVVLVGTAALVALSWAGLPQQIPVHFGWSGGPDQWGSKSYLIIGLLVAGLVYAGLTRMRSYPHKLNYPWAITAENAEVQYRLAIVTVAWLKLETLSIFALVMWTQVRVASGAMSELATAPIAVLTALLSVTLGVYVYLGLRAR